MLASLVLTPDEVTTLDACSHHAKHPRHRHRHRRRAQAVLGHHRGQSLNQLAVFFAVRYATVHGWLKAWREQGLAGLCEGVRAGRPPKLPPAAKKK
jgi:transposase